jgi:hypothetical protein
MPNAELDTVVALVFTPLVAEDFILQEAWAADSGLPAGQASAPADFSHLASDLAGSALQDLDLKVSGPAGFARQAPQSAEPVDSVRLERALAACE